MKAKRGTLNQSMFFCWPDFPRLFAFLHWCFGCLGIRRLELVACSLYPTLSKPASRQGTAALSGGTQNGICAKVTFLSWQPNLLYRRILLSGRISIKGNRSFEDLAELTIINLESNPKYSLEATKHHVRGVYWASISLVPCDAKAEIKRTPFGMTAKGGSGWLLSRKWRYRESDWFEWF